MDVLNATLIPIEDRVYRLIPVRGCLENPEKQENFRPPIRTDFDDNEAYDPDLPIIHRGNKFYITFFVPYQLVNSIRGYKGNTKKFLEQQGAKINIGDRKDDGVITIYGENRDIVSITYHRAMAKVTSSRLSKESTHFISLPINSSKIQESFLEFKKEILEKRPKIKGVDESIFQKPDKLHLTVTLLVLLGERDNQNAIAILTKSVENSLKDFNEKEFIVHVKGLEYMNDDPAEVDVLYAEVHELEEDNRLQILCDNIMMDFCSANLSKMQHDKVKQHVTLMNTLFRDKLENKEDKDEIARQTFDASSILEAYKDYDFGKIVVSEFHISVRYTTGPDGYYRAVKKIKLTS